MPGCGEKVTNPKEVLRKPQESRVQGCKASSPGAFTLNLGPETNRRAGEGSIKGRKVGDSRSPRPERHNKKLITSHFTRVTEMEWRENVRERTEPLSLDIQNQKFQKGLSLPFLGQWSVPHATLLFSPRMALPMTTPNATLHRGHFPCASSPHPTEVWVL